MKFDNDGTYLNEDGTPAVSSKPDTPEDFIRFRIDMHLLPAREWIRYAEVCILERGEPYIYAPHATAWVFFVTKNEHFECLLPESKWLRYEYMPANKENTESIMREERERIKRILGRFPQSPSK